MHREVGYFTQAGLNLRHSASKMYSLLHGSRHMCCCWAFSPPCPLCGVVVHLLLGVSFGAYCQSALSQVSRQSVRVGQIQPSCWHEYPPLDVNVCMMAEDSHRYNLKKIVSSQNMLLWHIDYFELKALEKQQM